MPLEVSELQVTGQTREAVISLPIPQRAHLERFEATERLSELFLIEVDVICEEAEVDFLSHLGDAVEITVSQTGTRNARSAACCSRPSSRKRSRPATGTIWC